MENQIVLSNGKSIKAYDGVIGINADGEIFDGYDSCLEAFQPLTNEDRVLLAKEMIARWEKVLRSAALSELGKLDGDML